MGLCSGRSEEDMGGEEGKKRATCLVCTKDATLPSPGWAVSTSPCLASPTLLGSS